jgi:hypothetical protein
MAPGPTIPDRAAVECVGQRKHRNCPRMAHQAPWQILQSLLPAEHLAAEPSIVVERRAGLRPQVGRGELIRFRWWLRESPIDARFRKASILVAYR